MSCDELNRKSLKIAKIVRQLYLRPATRLEIVDLVYCIVHWTFFGMHPQHCNHELYEERGGNTALVCLQTSQRFQKDAEAGQIIGRHWPLQITPLPLPNYGNTDSGQTIGS